MRIVQLDLIRGVALLGIFVINITLFAYSQAGQIEFYQQLGEFVPTMNNGLSEFLYGHFMLTSYSLVQALFSQKMMTLFSFLFGASIILITEKLDQKGVNSFSVFYRRNFWLMIIGALHLVVWYGDILFVYALSGFLLYPLRTLQAKTLICLSVPLYAACILLIGPALSEYYYASDNTTINASFSFDDLKFIKYFTLSLANMLTGMALYKVGYILGQSSNKIYRRWAIWGLLAGLALQGLGIFFDVAFDVVVDLNNLASLLQAMSYIGIIVLWSQSNKLMWLQVRLQAIGRAALTHYLLQTVISVLIFYPLFLNARALELDMLQQLMIVLCMWVFQLFIGKILMDKLKFGPVEWLWRSLYYWQRQPFRRK
ncbi:MAG: DUF418 domain-containing protein [Bermanella sp.]